MRPQSLFPTPGKIPPSPIEVEDALKVRGFAVAIDREDIFAFEEWWKRIESLILHIP